MSCLRYTQNYLHHFSYYTYHNLMRKLTLFLIVIMGLTVAMQSYASAIGSTHCTQAHTHRHNHEPMTSTLGHSHVHDAMSMKSKVASHHGHSCKCTNCACTCGSACTSSAVISTTQLKAINRQHPTWSELCATGQPQSIQSTLFRPPKLS